MREGKQHEEQLVYFYTLLDGYVMFSSLHLSQNTQFKKAFNHRLNIFIIQKPHFLFQSFILIFKTFCITLNVHTVWNFILLFHAFQIFLSLSHVQLCIKSRSLRHFIDWDLLQYVDWKIYSQHHTDISPIFKYSFKQLGHRVIVVILLVFYIVEKYLP